uniref:Uncharacterized protein n=1 Tax=Arundo donax TaxID=35708 RepID=A0A0A8YGF9_ARUDO
MEAAAGTPAGTNTWRLEQRSKDPSRHCICLILFLFPLPCGA